MSTSNRKTRSGLAPFWMAAAAVAGFLFHPGNAQASATQRACSAEPTDELIAYGDLVTCDVDPGTDVDQFRFAGQIDDIVGVVVSRTGGSAYVCVEILRPNGTTLDAACSNTDSKALAPLLSETGEYRIRVKSTNGSSVMSYALTLDRLTPVSGKAIPLDPGAMIDGGIISPRGEFDLYTFNGVIGDTITLVATDTSNTTAYIGLALRDPSGNVLKSPGNVNQSTFEQTLTANGLYTVVVSETGNDAELTYSLSYSCSGACPSLVLTRRYIDAVDIEDMPADANSSSETVALFQERNTRYTKLLIRDGVTGTNIKTIKVFGGTIEPIGLAAIGDQFGDQVSEVGVLGIVRSTGQVRVYVVDPVQGTVATPPLAFFNAAYSPTAVLRVADRNANSIPEVGVLAMEKKTGAVLLRILDGLTGTKLKDIAYPK